MIIKKMPKFDLDEKEFNVWVDFSDIGLEGISINKLECCIEKYIQNHLGLNNYILVDESITIQSRDSDDYYSYDIFYFHLRCKYNQAYIEKKRTEYQVKLDEYNNWYETHSEAIAEELEKRKKKEQHNSKIREIEAQIEALKEKKRNLQSA